MAYTESQTIAISSLASVAAGFSRNYFDGGRDAKRLASLGVNAAAVPPLLPDAESLVGTLSEVPPSAVMGSLAVLSEIAAIMEKPNPFADDDSTLGDAINRLALGSR